MAMFEHENVQHCSRTDNALDVYAVQMQVHHVRARQITIL